MHKTHNLDIIPAPNGDEAESLLLCGREGVVRLGSNRRRLEGALDRAASRRTATDLLQGAGEVRYGAFSGGQPYVTTIEPMHGDKLVHLHAEAGERTEKRRLGSATSSRAELVDGHAIATHDLLGLEQPPDRRRLARAAEDRARWR
jgi:hypothetical protein